MPNDSKIEVQEKEVMNFSEAAIPREEISYAAVNEEINIQPLELKREFFCDLFV